MSRRPLRPAGGHLHAIRARATVGEVSERHGEGIRTFCRPPTQCISGCIRQNTWIGSIIEASGNRCDGISPKGRAQTRILMTKNRQDGHDRG